MEIILSFLAFLFIVGFVCLVLGGKNGKGTLLYVSGLTIIISALMFTISFFLGLI